VHRRPVARRHLLYAQSVGNSSTAIAATVNEGHCDVFLLLTETWHTSHAAGMLHDRQLTPAERTTAASLDHRRLPVPLSPTTFKSTVFTVSNLDSTVALLLIYRPGYAVATDAFFTELSAYLEVFAHYKIVKF